MRRSGLAAGLFALACLAFAHTWWTNAQEPAKDDTPDQKAKDEEFWFSSARRRAGAAAQLALQQNPITLGAMRFKSIEELIWVDVETNVDVAPRLNADWLDDIVDGRPLPDIRAKTKAELPKSALPTYNAYSQALIYSFLSPADVFKKSAKENAEIGFAQLWNEPKINRGKVIPVRGRLVRVRKYEAPWPAKKEGIQHLYEGWLFGETKNSVPYCVIFPILPEGLQVAETMRRQASFEGYFLGRFKFRVGPIDESRDIDIPLFIGPTIRVAAEPPPIDDTPFSLVVLVAVVGLLLGLVAVFLLISWWFRKGDSAIQSQLLARKEQQTLEMMGDPEHWASNAEAPRPPMANPVPETGITSKPPEPPKRDDGFEKK